MTNKRSPTSKGAKNYLILFADLIGSTEVASEALPREFAELYVASFQWAARRAYEFVKMKGVFAKQDFTKPLEMPRIQGDEALSFTGLDELTDVEVEDCVASALAFAYVLKLMWLASPYNVRRLEDKQFPRGISIGLHIGPAGSVIVSKGQPEQIAGLHINIAKRIEGAAKDGTDSRIFASHDVTKRFAGWLHRHKDVAPMLKSPIAMSRFEPCKELSDLKGLPRKVQLYELIAIDNDIFTHAKQNYLQIATTPNTINGPAEKVIQKWAHRFLPKGNKPFHLSGPKGAENQMVVYDLKLADTVSGYIDCWFKALDQPILLFFDEAWLMMSAFFISCGLARHEDVGKAARERYAKASKRLFDLLEATAASKKNSKPLN